MESSPHDSFYQAHHHHLSNFTTMIPPPLPVSLDYSLFEDHSSMSSESMMSPLMAGDDSNEYFGSFFLSLSEVYLPVHGYLSLIVCIFGIFANILNIIVLTRKEMASPTNAILTGLAVADLNVMIEYIPFTIHSSIEVYEREEDKYSFPWAVFTLFHAHFSVIFHSISTWLTVILAVWRYTSVSFPTESKVWCSMRNAKLVIGATYVIVPIICFPVYLTFAIHHDNYPGRNRYFVNYSDISLKNDGLLKNINFWVFSVGLKLVPCILLTYLSIALIRLLMEAERRRQRLKASNLRGHIGSAQNVSIASDPARKPERQQSLIDSRKGSEESQVDLPTKEVIPGNPDEGATTSSSPPPRSTSGEHLIGSQVTPTPKSNNNNNTLRVSTHVGDFSSSTTGTSHSVQHTQPSSHHHSITTTTFNHHHHHSSQSDRTTKMLVAILLLFLVTEFPSGTVALLSGFLGESFHMNVYQPLGEIFDILALINSGINFILYCVMSRLFRKTFCKIFWPQKYRRDLSLRRFTQQNQNQIQSHLHLRPLTQNLTARPPTIGPLPPPPGIKCTSPSSVGFNHVEGKTFFPVEGNGSQSPTSQASIRMNQTTATTVNSRDRDVQSPVVVTQVVDRNHPFISKNCDFELPLCSTNSTSPKCPMSSPTETGDIISSSPNVTTTTVV